MNLELTQEQLALRAAVRRFLSERAGVADHVRPLLDDPTGSTGPVRQGLADLGTTGLLVHEQHGGAGAGMVEAGIVLEELGATVHPGPWRSTAVAAVRTLYRSGADGDATAKLLDGIAGGSTVATVGPLDPRAPRPRATPGRAVTVSGEVVVPDVAAATVVLLFADEKDGATGLFAIDAGDAGLTVEAVDGIDPTRKEFRVVLDAVPATRLGPADAAVRQAVADDVLVANAAEAVGAARALLDLTVEYAKVRHQFGHAIGSFQAVQHLCADMAETLELARSQVLHALWAADHAEPAEAHVAAVRAKAFSGRLVPVGDTAVQVHGGIGFTWESDVHLYLRRLLGWSAFLGTGDGYLLELGTALVRSHPTEGDQG